MLYGKLIYHNKSSTYFGTRVVRPLVRTVTKRNVTLTPIVRVNGSYINDSLNHINITRQLTFSVERPTFYKDWLTWGMDLGDWLTSKDKFVEYESFHFEPFRGWHWEARLSESSVVIPQKDNITNITVSSTCKPFLVNDEATKCQSVPTTPIYNPTKYSSLPSFHIVGNGDFTLTVNGVQYQFKDTDNEPFIDSERWIVYKLSTERRTSRVILLNCEYPVFIPGKNTISLQGSYSKSEY